MNKRLLDGMPYTSAAKTTPEYLKAKFKRIQRELDLAKKAQPNVTPLKRKQQ